MTCKEYFEKNNFTEYEGRPHCPFEYGINVLCLYSTGGCTKCWNQEAPNVVVKRLADGGMNI